MTYQYHNLPVLAAAMLKVQVLSRYIYTHRKSFQWGKNAKNRLAGEVDGTSSRLLTLHLRRLPLLPRRRTHHPLDILHPPEVEPGAEEHHGEVERTKGPENAKVQPLVRVIDVEPGRELVPGGVLAELAETVAAVLHVAAGLGDESGGVGLARLTGWGRESGEFGGGADDGAAVGGD